MEMLEESLCLPLCKGMLQYIPRPVEEEAAPPLPAMMRKWWLHAMVMSLDGKSMGPFLYQPHA